jgi:hypothetical protein
VTSSQEDFRKTWEDKHPRRIESKAYPRVSSNMASWETRELNGHFNGKIIKSSNLMGFSSKPCLITVPEGMPILSSDLVVPLHAQLRS